MVNAYNEIREDKIMTFVPKRMETWGWKMVFLREDRYAYVVLKKNKAVNQCFSTRDHVSPQNIMKRPYVKNHVSGHLWHETKWPTGGYGVHRNEIILEGVLWWKKVKKHHLNEGCWTL